MAHRSKSGRGLVPTWSRGGLGLLPLLLALGIGLLSHDRPAAAAPPAQASQGGVQIFEVIQEDLDRDGLLDRTIIRCAIVTPNDRVIVYDGGRNMRSSSDWRTATDFSDDMWIFDIGGAGGDSRASLIIDFDLLGSDHIARIYDASTTSDGLQYVVSGISASVSAPAFPAMIVRASGAWLYPDGSLNYNLNWQYDGPVANREQAARLGVWFPLDGNTDFEGELRDVDRDGVPEYLWSTLLSPVPLSEGFPRAGIQFNAGGKRPAPLEDVIFWPLLNRPDDPIGRNYFDTPIFLRVDWARGLITSFVFAGYPVEHGLHINSLAPLKRDEVNNLNFENPMAYYDLAADRDGRPELFIRFVHTPAGDPAYVVGGPTKAPMQMVQYSWNQQDEPALRWDYKLDLAGLNPVTSTVTYGEMKVRQVPHADLPGWVWGQAWAFATFVAYESGAGYLSSEGIYDWSTLEGVQGYVGLSAGGTLSGIQDYVNTEIRDIPMADQRQRQYLAGRSSHSPEELYQYILAGFRGEYGQIDGPAELYFSPIDARLHLLGASKGVYNLGDNRRLEYRNLNHDQFIDAWLLYQGGQVVDQLFQSGEFLVYGGGGQVRLRKAVVPAELFRTQPPASHAEWQALGERLSQNRREVQADDLRSLLQPFDGPELVVNNAGLRDYRPYGSGGFRFVLDLGPDYAVERADLLALDGLAPGSYVVSYDGSLAIEPLTPPALSARLLEPALTELEAGVIAVALRNDGRQDVPEALLELWAAQPGQAATIAMTQTVALLAETAITPTLIWAPPVAGDWSLAVQVRPLGEEPLAFEPMLTRVASAQPPSPYLLLKESTSRTFGPLALLGLLSFAGLASAIVWRQLSIPPGGQGHDPT